MGIRDDDRIRRAAQLGLAMLVGLVGAWLGALLLGRAEVPMGPFRVEVAAGFGSGETEIGLPPFGHLIADTHTSPLRISATLEDVGVERLTEVVGRIGVEGLSEQVQADALAEVRRLGVRLVEVSVIGALVLALLVFRTRWKLILAAAVAALVAVGGAEVLAWRTYRPAAFAEPTYTGSLGTAAKLIGPVREATDRIEDFRAGLQTLIVGATRAYTSIQAQPLVGDDVVRVLHISDIHATPLGMDFAQDIAESFDVDIVIDTGDTTSFGTSIENLIATRIPGFERPYVFVRGSHDPASLQSDIAALPNATVLDGTAEDVDGLTLYGLGHPAYTPARGEEVDAEAYEAQARAAGLEIAEDLETLDELPDIVAVHDDRMAETVAGTVPLVISGHFHETGVRVLNGTLFLRIGTTGGSGAGVFRGLDIPFSAEVLYLSRGPEAELVAYDVIEQFPDTGSLTVTRHLVSQDFGELVLTPSPSVSLAPPLTVTITPTPSDTPTPGD
jgi:predicted MPP superfamily phosphohydrolase